MDFPENRLWDGESVRNPAPAESEGSRTEHRQNLTRDTASTKCSADPPTSHRNGQESMREPT